MTSRTAAASATVRLSAPSVDMPCHPGTVEGTRPRLGLRPTRPQQDAGILMEPPPSLAWATGNMPAATADPAPPLEPPGVWPGFHGLRVAPNRLFSVTVIDPNSGVLVRPVRMNPADHGRRRWARWTAPGPSGAPMRAVGHRLSGHREQVLDRDGHPGEGWKLVDPDGDPVPEALGLGPGLLVVAPDDRVELRIALVDAPEAGVEHLERAHVHGPDGRGDVEGGGVFVHGARVAPGRPASPGSGPLTRYRARVTILTPRRCTGGGLPCAPGRFAISVREGERALRP